MSTTQMVRWEISIPSGLHAEEAGLFLAQLNDQNRKLTRDTRGMTAEELAWQPAPGTNTVGMLLAHIAIVEVYWLQVGPTWNDEGETHEALGIGLMDDGMPLKEDGLPPANLAGKDLAYFDDILARAREHTKKRISDLVAEDLTKAYPREPSDGSPTEEFTVRWALYHILEHQAGHYGQIRLLRHLYRRASGAGGK